MPYPTETDYVFEVGADPTSVFPTDEATLLLSFGRLMTTNEYHGIVIHSETTPTTSGQPSGYPTDWYAWNKRSLWHNPATNEVFGYHTGLGWEPIPVGDNTVDTDQIVDGAVTPEKLAVTGSAYQLLQINATATAWTLVDPSQIFSVDSITVDKLAVGNGFIYSDGASVFYQQLDPTFINDALGDGNLVWTTIAVGNPLEILRTNAAGTLTEWVSVIDAIQNGSVTVAKLSPGTGNAGKVARVASDGLSVTYQSLPSTGAVIQVTNSSALTTPTVGTVVTWAHAMPAVPWRAYAKLVCTVANNGFSVGDYCDPVSVQVGAGGSAEGYAAFQVDWDATNVTFARNNAGPGTWVFVSKVGASVAFVDTDWNVVLSAMSVA